MADRMHILLGTLLVAILASVTKATEVANFDAIQAVSAGANQFSSSFFQTVAEDNPGNLVISPLSADVVLAMAAYGAQGETANQFQNVLHFPSSNDLSTVGYETLIDSLRNVQENKLLLANKVFTAEYFTVKPNYKALTQNYFHSGAQQVEFGKPQEAANTINAWVQQNTNNLIKDIVTPDDLDNSTALVLVNAVYFKGLWKDQFDPALTRDMAFNIDSNRVKNVSTMFRRGNFQYGNLPDLNAKFVVIPYKGDELSMVIILPNEIDGLAQVEKKLQNVNVANLLSLGSEVEVYLHLPKFKVESKIFLNTILQKMGLTEAFTERANFSGIANGNLLINKVLQKAFIEVNEEGSEAAAATGLESINRIGSAPVIMKVDRPFIYSIIKTGIVNLQHMFTGHIVEP